MKAIYRSLMLAGLSASAIMASAMGASAENAKLRLAFLFADSMLPALHAQEKGYFKDAGLDVEATPVQGGPAAVAALASGEADVAYAAFVPPINARIGGLPVKLFLTLSHEVEPDFKYTFITATKASGISKLADVKGKKISMNANGGLCELMWRDHLAAVGLKIEDAEMVILPFPEQEKAMEQGNIDAACTINPFHASMTANANLGAVDVARGMLADLKEPVPKRFSWRLS
jgi:ABC-type nitrate/sulfonate/bicarbonate transport system substrate-binding protein